MSFMSNVISLLFDNWDKSNTKQIRPVIKALDGTKRVSYEAILIYDISNIPQDNASGGQSKKKSRTVALSIRSFKTYDQSELYVAEIERILNSPTFQTNPFGDNSWDIQDITDIQNDRSKTRGYYQIKVLVKFEQFNKTYAAIQ